MCPGEETVAAYVAGRLERDERDHFESHLDTCSACHELLAALGPALGARAPLATPSTSLGVGSTSFGDGDAPSWGPGDQLGRYVLISQLGAGGMGIVYGAYDPELDRKVAIKLVRHASDAAKARLRDEARAIAKLQHPNVVAVYDVGDAAPRPVRRRPHEEPGPGRSDDASSASGDVFVAMEHVEGVTLRDWLATPRAPSAIVAMFVQAGQGLAAAHAVGLVHRDVKPSNIIVGADGRARVLDFGLARARDDDDGVVGTPAYMAPEQRRGERVDGRADQFALCVALWEALGGEPVEGTEARDRGAEVRRGGGEPVEGTEARDRGAEVRRGGGEPVDGAEARRGPHGGARREDPRRERGERRRPARGLPDRTVRAIERGMAPEPAARFAKLDELLRELAPPPPRSWVIALVAVAVALAAVALAMLVRRDHEPASCARAGDPIGVAWGEPQRAALRAAFERTRVPYASSAATTAIAELDAWTERWRRGAVASCTATVIDRVQAPELQALRQACLDQLAERVAAIAAVTAAADATLVATSGTLASSLPSPERCDDAAALGAIAPPAETSRAEIEQLRGETARLEAAIVAGGHERVRPQVDALVARAGALAYPPLHARSLLLAARLELARLRYAPAIAMLHAGARAATEARDLELLAELWIELTQALGNDVATLAQADVFDGYAAALVARLPDREALSLQLELARCNRNISHTRADDAATLARHCKAAIERAGRAQPPRPAVANAARVRLGHFQRLLGDPRARATLREAVDEAVRVHGAEHPDTAVARYSLGIAEIAEERFAEGIAELRRALAIRRAAFPGDSLYVVESLLGLGDALASSAGAPPAPTPRAGPAVDAPRPGSGLHAEAIALVRDGLAMLGRLGKGDTLHGVNGNILLAMSLAEVKREDDALVHYLAAADIADRAIENREKLAVMALGLAADIEVGKGRVAQAIAHLERSLRLLERSKAAPLALGTAQQRLAELLLELGPDDRRARAMAELARASYAAANAAEPLAKLDAFMRKQRWR